AVDPETSLRVDTSIMFDWLNEGMSALTRYESVIARQLDRAIATLEARQARRRAREAAAEQQHSADKIETQFAEGNQ
ncbi:MAG TPA: hypothetical protein VNW24_15370, partial [Stellaceae bacterium]|nr:hypothetical protein [Stellaceae bacterium]